MFPILFRTDFGFITTFSAVWLSAIIACIWLLWRRHPSYTGWDALIASVVGALILGRAQFVWENAEWFAENPAARWNIFQGGHSYAGVILGALLGLSLWAIVTQGDRKQILAPLTLCLPLLHFAGWAACWFDGCGYGESAFIGWSTAELPNNFGLMAVRVQTQLFGMLLALIVGLVIWWMFRSTLDREPTTKHFWFCLAIFSISRAAIYQWQGNTVPLWGNIRSDMVLTALIGLFAVLFAWRAKN